MEQVISHALCQRIPSPGACVRFNQGDISLQGKLGLGHPKKERKNKTGHVKMVDIYLNDLYTYLQFKGVIYLFLKVTKVTFLSEIIAFEMMSCAINYPYDNKKIIFLYSVAIYCSGEVLCLEIIECLQHSLFENLFSQNSLINFLTNFTFQN